MIRQSAVKRIMASFLVLAVTFAAISVDWVTTKAVNKSINLLQARALALVDNDDYESNLDEIELTKVKYKECMTKLRLKQIKQKTFSWTPLMSFKFPENPTEMEEFEYNFKGIEYQSKLDSLYHKVNDEVKKSNEKVDQAFVKVYVLQEKIKFEKEQLEKAEKNLAKNKQRLITGQATQNDVETIEKKIDNLNTSIATDQRSFESEKVSLGNLLKVDVLVGYEFVNPFVSADLNRDILEKLQDTAVDKDQTYYELSTDVENSLISLNTNYDLMQNQYGSKVKILDPYISQAKQGSKIQKRALKSDYDQLLKDVDQPWNGKIKILFVKIPKEWFKGSTSGVRYVDDEPYVLYTNILEYQSLCTEQQTEERNLRNSVREQYDIYVSLRSSIDETESKLVAKKNEIAAGQIKNAKGDLSFEEYTNLLEEYDSLQMDLLEQKASLSSQLYALDRLTVGGVTEYLVGEAISFDAGDGGLSYISDDAGEAMYYYIHQLVTSKSFEFGVTKTDGFKANVTDYELWINGTLIGERTPINKSVKHLYLDLSNVEECFVRLYDNGRFVDDCDFDPSVYSAQLNVVIGYRVDNSQEAIVATYEGEEDTDLGLYSIRITPNTKGKAIKGFNIQTLDGEFLLDSDIISTDSSFRYLGAIKQSLTSLIINFYDESNNLIYQGSFSNNDNSIRTIKQENQNE